MSRSIQGVSSSLEASFDAADTLHVLSRSSSDTGVDEVGNTLIDLRMSVFDAGICNST